MLLVSKNEKFRKYAAWVLENYFPFIKDIKITDKITKAILAIPFDYVLYHEYEKEHLVNGISCTLCIIDSNDVSIIEQAHDISYFTIPKIKSSSNFLRSVNIWQFSICFVESGIFGIIFTTFSRNFCR